MTRETSENSPLVQSGPEEEPPASCEQVDLLEHAVVRVEMEDIVRRVESRGIVDGQRRDVGLDAERYVPMRSRESYRDCSPCPGEQTACPPTRVVVVVLPHRIRERRASGRHRALCNGRGGRWPVRIASQHSAMSIPKVSVLTRGVGREAMERDDKSSRRCVGRSCRSLARTSVGQSPKSSEHSLFRIGGWLARVGCNSGAGNGRADRTPHSSRNSVFAASRRPKCFVSLGKCTDLSHKDESATTAREGMSLHGFLFFFRP